MKEEARFYAERDRRSGQYVGVDAEVPVGAVGIVVGADAAETPAGQLATLGMVNMLARVHRTLIVDLPDVPLVVPSVLAASDSLRAAVDGTAKAINPFIRLAGAVLDERVPCVGIGARVPAGLDGYLVVDGWRGGIGGLPAAVGREGRSLLGAGAAACVAAAFLFHRARGRHPGRHVVSLWDLNESEDDLGPGVSWPLDVGDVLVIGAGAVGSGLAFWLSEVGVGSSWTFLDPDIVRLHNTNRGLGMTATDAGWPQALDGEPKAVVAATLLGQRGRSCVDTYRGWLAEHPDDRPDLVIPVANEDGIRSAVMGRGEPILIHGSTSPNWTAELHRHIPGIDDCIPCRLPDVTEARFRCSDGPVDPESRTSGDAALPFLSGGAGLLVLAALAQLKLGALARHPRNHWRLHLDLGHRLVTTTCWSCSPACTRVLPRDVRQQVRARGRWDHLDIAAD